MKLSVYFNMNYELLIDRDMNRWISVNSSVKSQLSNWTVMLFHNLSKYYIPIFPNRWLIRLLIQQILPHKSQLTILDNNLNNFDTKQNKNGAFCLEQNLSRLVNRAISYLYRGFMTKTCHKKFT